MTIKNYNVDHPNLQDKKILHDFFENEMYFDENLQVKKVLRTNLK